MKGSYQDNYDAPYMISGFHYVEGEWNTGYVIEDESGNQYVWIPVTNKEKEEVQKLIKKDFTIEPIIAKEYCVDDNYEAFIKSSLENGGFYISRYELGVETDSDNSARRVVSKAGKEILKDLKYVQTMYPQKSEFTCELINGYAYDTTIEWLKKSEKIQVFDVETDNLILTGRNSVRNVFDIFDNVLEITRRNKLQYISC